MAAWVLNFAAAGTNIGASPTLAVERQLLQETYPWLRRLAQTTCGDLGSATLAG